jgi:hypothetical protein
MPITRNSAHCLICDDEIESKHVHDYVKCTCGQIAVDGGREYIKRGWLGTFWIDTSEVEGGLYAGEQSWDDEQ